MFGMNRAKQVMGTIMILACVACAPAVAPQMNTPAPATETPAAAANAPAPKIVFSLSHPGPGDIMLATVTHATGTVTGTFRQERLFFNETKKGEWKAIVAVDLHTKPGVYPLEVAVAGRAITHTVRIYKKHYPLERLTLPPGMVTLSPKDEARAEREQRQLDAIWPVDSPRYWKGDFVNPLPGDKIGTRFGVRRILNGIPKSPHSGVDVHAAEGAPVHAPNNGVVALVADQFYAGNCVFLDHGQGIYTMFFHFSKVLVHTGEHVKKGQTLGLVGSTGRATGPHLHWGARVEGARVDPLELIHLKLD